jgi:MarR family 2-MHQ and catechol resistance regulon transcriptional repressor
VSTKYSGSKEQRLALDTFVKLMRSVNVLTGELREMATPGLKITVSQLGVLEALLHLGTLSQKQLCQKILRTKGNLSLVVENLEKAGLVERHRDQDDRRKIQVSLTDMERNVIGDIFPPTHKLLLN